MWKWTLALLSGSALAVTTPEDILLQKMQQALKQHNYQTRVAYQRDGLEGLVQVNHAQLDGHEVVLVEQLSGAPTTMYRIDNNVVVLNSGNDAYSIESPYIPMLYPQIMFTPIERLKLAYRLTVLGKERIAGEVCQNVSITPIKPDRYNHLICMDVVSSLPLKYELKAGEQTVERMLTTSIELNQADHVKLKRAMVSVKPPMIKKPTNMVDQLVNVDQLPAGFKVEAVNRRTLLGTDHPVNFISFSDGAVQASVYISVQGGPSLPNQLQNGYGLSLYSQLHNNNEIVAVGKLPVSTLQALVNAVIMR